MASLSLISYLPPFCSLLDRRITKREKRKKEFSPLFLNFDSNFYIFLFPRPDLDLGVTGIIFGFFLFFFYPVPKVGYLPLNVMTRVYLSI